jgi:hypothetical protein
MGHMSLSMPFIPYPDWRKRPVAIAALKEKSSNKRS